MKKVLSFVLVLSMILGSFGMAFAAPADVVGKDYEDAVNALVELGVVAGYEDGTYRPENIVTRAEMATFIIKAMGLADYAVGKSAFTDMAGHWADPFVAYAASLGFVAGNTDGTFAPDATVSYDQAITMLVQALGYKAEYLTGGYPGAFVNQAKALGMLDGVKSGAAGANRGDVAVLLFNTLDKEFVRYDNEGLLQETGDYMITRLDASKYNGGAEFVVTGEEPSVINLKEYQGALVTAYKNSDNKIIAIEEVKTIFLKGDYDADAATKKFVTTDDVEYKFNLTDTVVTQFTNGNGAAATTVAATTADNTSWAGVTIAAKVDGNYLTHVYSIADWNAKATVRWTDDLTEQLAEKDKLDGKTFVMTTSDEIDTDEFVLVGVDALKDIKKDNIVTYYLSNDTTGDVVRVEVGTAVVEGKVQKLAADGKEAVIGGKTYDVNLITGSLALGDEGQFFMNFDGEIAAVEKTSTKAEDYAIVTVANGFDTAAFGDAAVMKIKMVTADGKEAVYTIEKDFAKTTSEAAFATDAVIAYNIDKNGEIDKVVKQTTYDAVKLTAKGYLDGYKVASNVVVFDFDGTDYAAATLADVPVNAELGDTYFVLNDDKEVAVIVLAGAYGEDEESVYGVFVSSMKVENADEKEVYEVQMFVAGAKAEYLTTDDAVAVPTDVALYELGFSGKEITSWSAVTAASSGAMANTTVSAIKDGNLQLDITGDAYVEVASDVVVYLINKDGKLEISEFSAISKGDLVTLYELDEADKNEDGIDVIVFDAQ